MRILNSLLRTILPHMRSKNLPACSEDDMCRRVMISKNIPSPLIDFTCDLLPDIVRVLRMREGLI